MKLTTVHQILMASFVALGILFALRSLYLLARGDGPTHLALALAGLAVAAGAGLYLRAFRKRLLEKGRPSE